MAARRSFLSTAIRVGEAVARQHAAAQRRQGAAEARATRESAREQLRRAFDSKRQLQLDATRQVEQLNSAVSAQIDALTSLLASGINATGPLDFERLKFADPEPPFECHVPPATEPAPVLDTYLPPPLQGLLAVLPWSRRAHADASALARQRFDRDLEAHRARSEASDRAAADAHAKARADHEKRLEEIRQEVAAQNADIDSFSAAYAAADPVAVAEYGRIILENSDYPEGFSKKAKTVFLAESKQLIVQYECPSFEVVPEVASYRFVKAKHEITSTQRPATQRRGLYAAVIAQIALRTLHELFSSDTREHIDVVVFNGHVHAIDRGTGQPVYPCIISVRVTYDVFKGIDLANVDPLACLKTLKASVSPRPNELVPVRPVIEFDMTDPRFVTEVDVLSGLDQRPNLMALTPSEFESLITNLFEAMGLETRQTQASRDGGVDCVAYDPRPIFGGKVIIQAKRYKNTVGVSAVRDLFGTLQNEGASKGILVTTSGYGKAAFEFANGKPLELLEGSHLLYLLEQHAGIRARIDAPDSWKDPIPDLA